MRPVKRPLINPPNTYAWKYGPGRTMETYLGYQMLVYVGIILLAEYLFSLQFSGISPQAYLLVQFFILLLLCAGSFVVPPLLNYLARYPFTGMNAVRDALLAYSEKEIDDEDERGAYLQEIALNGYVPPAARQQYAMAVIVCLLLCQLFIISVWIQDGILIWRPAWVDGIIDWMRAHTVSLDDEKRSLFIIAIRNTIFAEAFPDDHAFLASTLGASQLFFHFLFIFMFPVLMTNFYILSSPILDYLGFEKINPRYIESFDDFLKLLFLSIPLFCFLLGPVIVLIYIPPLPTHKWVMGISYWNKTLSMFIVMLILITLSLKMFSGWYHFFTRPFLPARDNDDEGFDDED